MPLYSILQSSPLLTCTFHAHTSLLPSTLSHFTPHHFTATHTKTILPHTCLISCPHHSTPPFTSPVHTISHHFTPVHPITPSLPNPVHPSYPNPVHQSYPNPVHPSYPNPVDSNLHHFTPSGSALSTRSIHCNQHRVNYIPQSTPFRGSPHTSPLHTIPLNATIVHFTTQLYTYTTHQFTSQQKDEVTVLLYTILHFPVIYSNSLLQYLQFTPVYSHLLFQPLPSIPPTNSPPFLHPTPLRCSNPLSSYKNCSLLESPKIAKFQ